MGRVVGGVVGAEREVTIIKAAWAVTFGVGWGAVVAM